MNNNCYIRSFEASDLYSHIYRGYNLKDEYIGMIPYSLELIQLESLKGFKVRHDKNQNKISPDIINVTFDTKVKNTKDIITKINEKISKAESQIIEITYQIESLTDRKQNEKLNQRLKKAKEYLKKLQNFHNKANGEHWQEVKIPELRKWIYTNGFTIDEKNKRTGNIKSIHYVVYKRSPAKARTGQCLFIKESLYKNMIKWSRINLPFRKNKEIDYPSLLATESLTLSSIEDTIKIPVENMLLINDVDSVFRWSVDRVFNDNGKIVCAKDDNFEIINSLYDGESLLDSSLFDGHGFMQLRQHFFKSAAFNCNVQMFLRDYFEAHIGQSGGAYDDWKLKDMFGNEIFAKEARFIFTPNSLKVLKFGNIVGGKDKIYEYWRNFVKSENCIFGVCKSEKPSKHGYADGKIINQLSYQMINSLQAKEDDIIRLSAFEVDYIKRLQNDDATYIDYLKYDANKQNANDMWVALYQHNSNIVNTQEFCQYRAQKVHAYKVNCMQGHIRLQGDYCTMCGNGLSMLYQAVGVPYRDGRGELHDNEVYCTGFDFDKPLVGFRNPHTTPGSVLIVKNVHNGLYERYFNATDNIVYVNSIDFPLQDTLAGSDFDGDTVLLIDNPDLLKIANRMHESGKYRIYINDIDSSKKKYKLCPADMVKIDAILGESQKTIGQDIDWGAFAQSLYWATGDSKYYEYIQITSALSNIAIDNAKKLYDIDLMDEINKIKKQLPNVEKPLFFRFVGKSKNKNVKSLKPYNCPMDYLYNVFNNIKRANKKDDCIDLSELLNDKYKNIYTEDRKQADKIIDMIISYSNYTKFINAKYNSCDKEDKEIKETIIQNANDRFKGRMQKLKINCATMYRVLSKVLHIDGNITTYLNALFNANNMQFLSLFEK